MLVVVFTMWLTQWQTSLKNQHMRLSRKQCNGSRRLPKKVLRAKEMNSAAKSREIRVWPPDLFNAVQQNAQRQESTRKQQASHPGPVKSKPLNESQAQKSAKQLRRQRLRPIMILTSNKVLLGTQLNLLPVISLTLFSILLALESLFSARR